MGKSSRSGSVDTLKPSGCPASGGPTLKSFVIRTFLWRFDLALKRTQKHQSRFIAAKILIP
jgi:hypothetical protein